MLVLPKEFNEFRELLKQYLLEYEDCELVLKYLKSINMYTNGNIKEFKNILLKVNKEFNNVSDELSLMSIDNALKIKQSHYLYNIYKNLNLVLNGVYLKCEWCKEKNNFIYFIDSLTCMKCYEKY